jgi:tRNA 2-thiocytidine biosynthesis protein TtcA
MDDKGESPMAKELSPCLIAERSLIKKYRRELWNPFIAAVKRYELVSPGDRIAVCLSGGKDSMVLAKLMQELLRHTEQPFELRFPGDGPGVQRRQPQLAGGERPAAGGPPHRL